MIKKKCILYILLPLLVFLPISCTAPKAFNHFTEEEKESLKTALMHLLEKDVLGYTLYGNKPIYWTGARDPEWYGTEFSNYEDVLVIHNHLEALKKLALQGNKFYVDYHFFEESNFHRFLFINKNALKKVIKKNLSFFQTKVGEEMTAKMIYNDILNNGLDAYDGQAVIGTLLGYGIQNSLTWEESSCLHDEVAQAVDLKFIYEMGDSDEASNAYQSALLNYANTHSDKWGKYLTKQFDYGNKPVEGILINFAYHSNSQESKEIIKDYKKAQKKINKLMKDKRFLEKILRKIES